MESDFYGEQRSPRILSEVITLVRRQTNFFSARNRLSLSNKRLSPYEDIIIETFQCNCTLALQSSDDVSSGSSTLSRGGLFIYLLFIYPFYTTLSRNASFSANYCAMSKFYTDKCGMTLLYHRLTTCTCTR